MSRRKLSPDQAKRLAEEMRIRYPDATPREIMEMVYDPSLEGGRPVLGDYYRGVFVPPQVRSASEDQQQAWKSAIDQRLFTQPLRERQRAEAERVGTTDAVRRRISDVVKPVSMVASVTPYDLGLGDLGYAAGELIDPKGTYEDAALAAGGGLLTGGLGSGALMTKAAKEARAMQKAADRADDFGDITPTVIKENPTVPDMPESAIPSKQRPFYTEPPRLRPVKKLERNARLNYETPFYDRMIPGGLGSYRDLGLAVGSVGGVVGATLALHPQGAEFLEKIRGSTDYGNAFSETTQMNTPDMYDSSDDLRDIGPMLQRSLEKAIRMNDEIGMVPSDLIREIGKLEALQNTKRVLESADDRALQSGLMDPMKRSGFRNPTEARRQAVQSGQSMFEPSEFNKALGYASMYPDRESLFEPSEFSKALQLSSSGFGEGVPSMEEIILDREVQYKPSLPIEDPMFGPDEPPMVGPANPTPRQMRAMREVAPAMEDFGE